MSASTLLLVWSLCTLGFILVSGQLCPSLNLTANMATEDNIASVNVSSGPISVTVTCDKGFVLGSGEASQVVECNNVGNVGEWDSLTECVAVSCDSIPSIINGHVTYGDTAYGSIMSVACASGRTLSSGKVSIDLRCDAVGDWSPVTEPNNTSLDCTLTMVSYKGCYKAFEDLPASLTNVISLATCIQHCRTIEAAIAGMTGSDCYCGNLAEFEAQTNDMDCTSPCGVDAMAFCGGPGSKYSLFAVFDGCYIIEDSSVFDDYVDVGGKLMTACLEYCRARDAIVAMTTRSHRCKCVNETASISAAVVNDQLCTSSSKQLEEIGVVLNNFKTVVVQRLDYLMHPRTGDSCLELFQNGVMLHDFYYTSDTEKEFCQFVDGTVCEAMWVGYEGQCYHFSLETGDFHTSHAYCQDHDSHLIAVTSADEEAFVKYSVEKFAKSRSAEDVWYLGMFDSRLSASFQWGDGSLVTYSNFEGSEPSRPYQARCVAARYDEGELGWIDQMCDEVNNFICKKNKDLYFGCIEVTSSDLTLTFNDDLMTTVECRQKCLSLSKTYSAVHSQSCYCMDTPPSHVKLDWTSCEIPCPGNQYQSCGGSNAEETKTTIFVTGGLWSEDLAEGCDELEQQGLTEGTFLTSQGMLACTTGNAVLCPFSWINLNGNCYKFLTASMDRPCYTCAEQGGYMASFLDREELTSVRNAIMATRTLRNQDRWAVGLSDQNINGVLRWSNGQFYNYSAFERVKTIDKKCHVLNMENDTYQFITTKCAINENPFICERGSDYQGCYPTPSADPVFGDYQDLTLPVCVERCRGEGKRYALVNLTHCWCNSSLDTASSQPPGNCNQFILAEKGQQAGGVNLVSAYDVQAYAPYAESCEELFTQGILVPGTYLIGGEATYCSMADNTTCPTDSEDSWLGVGQAGYCLMFGSEAFSADGAIEECRARGGVLASVADEAEWDFLIRVLRYSLQLSGSNKIVIGARDEFINGLYSWADGSLMKHGLSDLLEEYHTTSTSGIVEVNDSSKTMQNQLSDGSSTFICSRHRDYEGCYEHDGSMTPIAEFTSMTLTLCRQLCLGQSGQTKALLHTTKCYCTTQAVLDTLSLVTSDPDCDVRCQGHSGQSCATGSKLRAYKLETTDLAGNCTELYSSGVLYRGTYLLQNATDGTTSLEECGFEVNDRTCAPGWLAHGNMCLQVLPRPLTQQQAADFCFQRGGYLFTPKSPETFQYISNIINAVPSWSRYSTWRTGAREVMLDGHLVLADGIYLKSQALVDDIYFDDSVVMDTTSQILLRNNSLEPLPFVCELGEVLTGCEETDTLPGYSQSSDNLMSVSQCMETCRGQPDGYAEFAVRNSTCECYTSHNTVSTGTCTSPCPAQPSQQCGHTTYSSFYNTAKYTEAMLTSCTDLYLYGVVEQGWYDILFEEQTITVQCFNYGTGYSPILSSSAGVITASSEELGYLADDARLNSGGAVPSSWMPSEEPSWMKIDLLQIYLIKAIFLQGGQSVTDQAWVETVKIEYTHGEVDWITHADNIAANSARSTVNRMFLASPLVGDRLRLTPLTSHIKPALRVELLGQLYQEFNHTDRYVGCFKTLDSSVGPVTSVQQCIDLCSPSHPFLGLVADDVFVTTCYCGSTLGQYGQVSSSLCGYQCGFDEVTCSRDTDKVMAVYRAYDIGCPAILSPSNSTRSVTKVYNVAHVYTFQTEITYTCETGYEFPGGETELTVTCLHSNQWDSAVVDCQVKHCDPPADVDHASKDSTDTAYNSTITYTCESGYVTSSLADSFNTVCLDSKTWSLPPQPCTPRPCAAVPEVQNAVILENNASPVFGDALTYQCYTSSKFSDDSYNKTTSCGADGEWSPLPATCTYYECPSPPHVPGADVTHDGGMSASYMCIEDYEFEDGSYIINSTCDSSFIWSSVDTSCIPTATVKQRASSVCLSRNGHRIVGDVHVTSSRSAIACGVLCLQNTACRFYNYNLDDARGNQNCQLFVDRTSSFVFAPDSSWNAYMLGNDGC